MQTSIDKIVGIVRGLSFQLAEALVDKLIEERIADPLFFVHISSHKDISHDPFVKLQAYKLKSIVYDVFELAEVQVVFFTLFGDVLVHQADFLAVPVNEIVAYFGKREGTIEILIDAEIVSAAGSDHGDFYFGGVHFLISGKYLSCFVVADDIPDVVGAAAAEVGSHFFPDLLPSLMNWNPILMCFLEW